MSAQPKSDLCNKGLHPMVEGNILRHFDKARQTTIQRCAACMREKWHANKERYRHKEANQAARELVYRQKNQEKHRARVKVMEAVRRGDLVRPERCQNCTLVDIRIEASHDDYARPLDVTWLCVRCHRAKDRKFKLPGELDSLAIGGRIVRVLTSRYNPSTGQEGVQE